DSGPDLVLQLTRQMRRGPSGIGNGLAHQLQVIAQQLRQKLRSSTRLQQHGSTIVLSYRSPGQSSDFFGDGGDPTMQLGFRRKFGRAETLVDFGVPQLHAIGCLSMSPDSQEYDIIGHADNRALGIGEVGSRLSRLELDIGRKYLRIRSEYF